jgi:transposase
LTSRRHELTHTRNLKLKQRLDGIIAHCRWLLHTRFFEGVNNKIKVIKRVAYGYRNGEYFFLRIRQFFPRIE